MTPDYSSEIPNEEEKLIKMHGQGYECIKKAFEESEELQKLYFYFEKENYWEFLRAYQKNPTGKAGIFLGFILKIHSNDRVREALGVKNPFSSSKRAYDVTSQEKRTILGDIIQEEQTQRLREEKLKLSFENISQNTSQEEKIQYPQDFLSEDDKEEESGMFAGMMESVQNIKNFVNFESRGQKQEEQNLNAPQDQENVYIEEEKADFIKDVEKMAEMAKKQKEKDPALGYEDFNPKIFTNPNLFEGITPLFDLEQIRRYKEKGFQMLIFGNLIFFVSTIICLTSAIYLAVSRDTELVVLTFHEPTQTFVSVPRIDKGFKPRDELKKNVISAYVYDRETINRFDDRRRDEIIKSQSTSDVWRDYWQLHNTDNSVYKSARDEQSQTYRKIEIISVQLVDQNNTAFVTFRASLREGLKTRYVKDYKATIKYQFVAQKNVKPEDIRNNPLGFMVYRYELETLRELENPQNIVIQDGIPYVKIYAEEDPSGSKLKRDYPSKKNSLEKIKQKETQPNQTKGEKGNINDANKEPTLSIIGNKKSNTGGSE